MLNIQLEGKGNRGRTFTQSYIHGNHEGTWYWLYVLTLFFCFCFLHVSVLLQSALPLSSTLPSLFLVLCILITRISVKTELVQVFEKEQLLLYITLEDIRCVFTTNNQVKTLPLFFRHSLLLDETRVWRSSSRQEKHNRKKQAANVKARGWTISRLSLKCLFPSPFTMCSHA